MRSLAFALFSEPKQRMRQNIWIPRCRKWAQRAYNNMDWRRVSETGRWGKVFSPAACTARRASLIFRARRKCKGAASPAFSKAPASCRARPTRRRTPRRATSSGRRGPRGSTFNFTYKPPPLTSPRFRFI